jgi:hypothetical protein
VCCYRVAKQKRGKPNQELCLQRSSMIKVQPICLERAIAAYHTYANSIEKRTISNPKNELTEK